jgi:thymidine kinase
MEQISITEQKEWLARHLRLKPADVYLSNQLILPVDLITGPAGSGKTEYAIQQSRQAATLYLCYTKATRADAESRVGNNVIVRTIHSQALQLLNKPIKTAEGYMLLLTSHMVKKFFERELKDQRFYLGLNGKLTRYTYWAWSVPTPLHVSLFTLHIVKSYFLPWVQAFKAVYQCSVLDIGYYFPEIVKETTKALMIADTYEEKKFYYGHYDFDDLLLSICGLRYDVETKSVIKARSLQRSMRIYLKSREPIPTYDYVIIDEFQLLSPAQILALRSILMVVKPRKVIIAGDNTQISYMKRFVPNWNMTEALKLLGVTEPKHIEMTNQYRIPAPVMEYLRETDQGKIVAAVDPQHFQIGTVTEATQTAAALPDTTTIGLFVCSSKYDDIRLANRIFPNWLHRYLFDKTKEFIYLAVKNMSLNMLEKIGRHDIITNKENAYYLLQCMLYFDAWNKLRDLDLILYGDILIKIGLYFDAEKKVGYGYKMIEYVELQLPKLQAPKREVLVTTIYTAAGLNVDWAFLALSPCAPIRRSMQMKREAIQYGPLLYPLPNKPLAQHLRTAMTRVRQGLFFIIEPERKVHYATRIETFDRIIRSLSC